MPVELTDISKVQVKAIIAQLKHADDFRIEIYTYADDIGSDGYNQRRLSARRAEALRNLLIENGEFIFKAKPPSE